MSRRENNIYPNQIRRYRRKRHLRLRDVAYKLELSGAAHISHWEKGRKLPNLENALKLSAIIQCPVEILFFDLFNNIRNEIYLNKKLNKNQNNYDKIQSHEIHT